MKVVAEGICAGINSGELTCLLGANGVGKSTLLDVYKRQVQDYADMLCRSPKTLSNLFSACGLPSPLRIIHERIDAEARCV